MKTRILHTKFWDDGFIADLSKEGRLLFLYAITNSNIGLTGAYECRDRVICFYTGLTQEELAKEKEALKPRIIFIDGWVVVLNASKYNNYASNDKQRKAYVKEYNDLPEHVKPYIKPLESDDTTSIPGYQKGKYDYKHREVAEAILKRPLTCDEVVHHIDRDPSNNHPNNLAVLSQKNHVRLHRGEISLDDTSIILLSDLSDTEHKSETINNKSKYINQKSEKEVLQNTPIYPQLSEFKRTFAVDNSAKERGP